MCEARTVPFVICTRISSLSLVSNDVHITLIAATTSLMTTGLMED